MAERTRPIRIEFCVTEQERQLIRSKMAQLGTKNMGAYLRKMAIDGYIINVDYTQQKKLAASVSRAASNINQICRRINSSGHLYAEDVAELKERQAEIWSLLKETQRKELLFCERGNQMENSIGKVPIHLKMTLTAKEAAEYSNIGINKIDGKLRSPNCPFVLFVGSKKLVKRKEFEQYISQALVI